MTPIVSHVTESWQNRSGYWNHTEYPGNETVGNITESPAGGALLSSFKYEAQIYGIEQYLMPWLFVFGVAGNILAFITFSTKEMSPGSTAFMFRVLAVVDGAVVAVYNGLHILPQLANYSIIAYNDATCKLFAFSYFSLRSLSSWMLVLIGVERALGVSLPHRARILCTLKRFRIAVAAVGVSIVVLYCPLIRSTMQFTLVDEGSTGACLLQAEIPNYSVVVFPYMEILVSSVLPFAAILSCNTIIILALLRSLRMRQTSSGSGETSSSNGAVAMLLTVSFVFILLRIPYCVYFFLELHYRPWPQGEIYQITMLLGTVASACDGMNHSLNIFLYCVCGNKFRSALFSILHLDRCCNGKGKAQPASKNTLPTNISASAW